MVPFISKIDHPGRMLRRMLNDRQIAHVDVVRTCRLDAGMFARILSGERNISTLTGVKVSLALGLSKDYFGKAQASYNAEMIEPSYYNFIEQIKG